jgi:hypothetical protein
MKKFHAGSSSFNLQSAISRFQMVSLLLIALAGCSEKAPNQVSIPARNSASTLERETWDICYLQGVRVGYVQTGVYRDLWEGMPAVRIEYRNEIEVNRNGQPSQISLHTTSFEKPSGELICFENEMKMGPQTLRMTGRVVGDSLETEITKQGIRKRGISKWPIDGLGFHAVEQSLLRKPMRPGELRTMESLLPEFETVRQVTVALGAKDWEEVDLPAGRKKLLRIETASILPEGKKIPQTIWADKNGDILKTHSDQMNLENFRTTKEVALKSNAGSLFDINVETSVQLDRPIPNARETKKIRYRLHLPGDDPAKTFPAGPTQQINPLDAETAEMTVFSIRPGQKDGNPEALAEKPTPADLAPNSMIQCDDPLIVSLAEKSAGSEADPWKTAIKLEQFVHDYIHQKDFSQVFASAAETAKTREGDCTEHAVLLAAMLRARKIPARAAVGLIYFERRTKKDVSPEFAYHMWVEAYIDGRWIPLDATLGRGGVGAEHLKIASANLQEASMYDSFLPVMQLVGKLKVEVLETE